MFKEILPIYFVDIKISYEQLIMSNDYIVGFTHLVTSKNILEFTPPQQNTCSNFSFHTKC
jgi:hypothetical protein